MPVTRDPDEMNENLSLRLPVDLLAEARRLAIAEDRSLASVIRRALREHLEQAGRAW